MPRYSRVYWLVATEEPWLGEQGEFPLGSGPDPYAGPPRMRVNPSAAVREPDTAEVDASEAVVEVKDDAEKPKQAATFPEDAAEESSEKEATIVHQDVSEVEQAATPVYENAAGGSKNTTTVPKEARLEATTFYENVTEKSERAAKSPEDSAGKSKVATTTSPRDVTGKSKLLKAAEKSKKVAAELPQDIPEKSKGPAKLPEDVDGESEEATTTSPGGVPKKSTHEAATSRKDVTEKAMIVELKAMTKAAASRSRHGEDGEGGHRGGGEQDGKAQAAAPPVTRECICVDVEIEADLHITFGETNKVSFTTLALDDQSTSSGNQGSDDDASDSPASPEPLVRPKPMSAMIGEALFYTCCFSVIAFTFYWLFKSLYVVISRY